ncbi:MAG: type IV pilus twitching motility protein PilT [Candidatus Omnitrophota bacterium]|nr:MAG: type IV pilus twitching motility protein PilT [Candidatus Omnitrophota bacterium]
MEAMEKLLKVMVEKKASDLHITAGAPPQLRIDGKLVNAEEKVLTAQRAKELTYGLLSKEAIKEFEENLELDMSFGIEGLSRFRLNVYQQRGAVGCAIRRIPYQIMTPDECGLPLKAVKDFCRRSKGLVLVTGATGSGKSTSLAAMINMINQERHCHIITVEDPIEYTFKNIKAVIEQREVGADTRSFSQALRHILREDPNVILIGEMRDLETIQAALNIAETGHLVFATLHTSDSVQTINRVVDVFPAHQQQQVRAQLSFVLLGVLSQQLIPSKKGGRVLATEVLSANHAVRSLIREGKAHQVYSAIQTGQKEGMRTMNQALYELCQRGIITEEEALGYTTEVQDLQRLFKKA